MVSRGRRLLLPALFAALTVAASLPTLAQTAPSAAPDFYRENDVAMERMMADMHVAPTGDVDRDFVAMMIPHHQGAIDMAVAQLRHGHNPQLKRIAQEIIIEQQQEIAAMRMILGQPLPPSSPAPTQPRPQREPEGGATHDHHTPEH